MNQIEKARAFAALHRKGEPVVLYNIWDVGSAVAVAESGARALATGSWSVAATGGFGDGQKIPLLLLCDIARGIVGATDLPVSIDFEGGYAETPGEIAINVAHIVNAGAVGVNIEDQVVGGEGLHGIEAQAERLAAIRAMADARDLPFFVNARTDVFLKEPDGAKHADLLDEAIQRGYAYEKAGARGFFVPGLSDPALIARICKAVSLPVNVMMKPGSPDVATLAALGVARISHGPFPYRAMIAWLKEQAQGIYKS
ncbi:isocitrate lyase/PEP mutase family protein [Pararhizobium antarcticum]|uniref:Phosphonomutase n=1 Tax=Pararhizobium antarcticum TaxID=1798805 RepID=A0A657LKT6_9HYPH|nr:isocitrate lyase/phosphoenolpyruvate mutase family protein [Pararhizobium antarcticum]OJF90480.1 phosphonomutase [Pararhizobium antarcticum]OJF98556.1 phosphonomutase [Rhizobium sp. 58]